MNIFGYAMLNLRWLCNPSLIIGCYPTMNGGPPKRRAWMRSYPAAEAVGHPDLGDEFEFTGRGHR